MNLPNGTMANVTLPGNMTADGLVLAAEEANVGDLAFEDSKQDKVSIDDEDSEEDSKEDSEEDSKED